MTDPRRPWTQRLAALLLTLPLGTAAAAETAFLDQFDSFDEVRWYVSDGWSNGDWQACTWSRRMVTVDDGMLRLSLAPTQAGSDEYLCGELQSDPQFGYGAFEARLRTDKASGVNAAFFTYIGPVHAGRTHEEIDFEVLTRNTSSVDVNTYRDGTPNGGTSIPLAQPADEAFHTYSFIWEPERLRWFIDGALVHEIEGPDMPQPPQKIYLSHWNTRTLTEWMGEFTDPGRPLTLAVDWVAYTPLDQGCQFPDSVLCTLEAAE